MSLLCVRYVCHRLFGILGAISVLHCLLLEWHRPVFVCVVFLCDDPPVCQVLVTCFYQRYDEPVYFLLANICVEKITGSWEHAWKLVSTDFMFVNIFLHSSLLLAASLWRRLSSTSFDPVSALQLATCVEGERASDASSSSSSSSCVDRLCWPRLISYQTRL